MPYKLHDLIDIQQFQKLQDRLNEIYSFPSAIIDNEGHVLTATAWQDVCIKFHRFNKESAQECIKSDQYILDHIAEANPAVSYRCPRGLVDNATPIIIDGVHYGNFFTGQFFLEKPDMEFFKKQAQKFGYDEKAYLEAVAKVPVWTQQQLDSYLFFIKGLIEVIAGIGLKNLRMLEARKQIEISENKYRNLVETSAQPIFTLNGMGGFLFMNTFAAQQFGGRPEDFIGKSMWDIFPPDLAEIQMQHVLHAIHSGQLVETISETFVSGVKRCYTARLQPLKNESGTFDSVLSILTDITDRIHAEKALEETSTQLQAIYDSLVDGLLIADAETKVMLRANPAVCAMFGYSEREFVGKTVLDLHPADSLPQVLTAFDSQLKGETVIAENLPCKRKDGSIFYADIGSHPIVYNEQKCLVGFFRDITERKQTEQALQRSEAQYRFLVENISDVIWQITPDLRFVYCSPVDEHLRGYKTEEVIGRPIYDFMTPESAARVRELATHRQKIAREGGTLEKTTYEAEQIRKDGTRIWTEITSHPIYSPEGKLTGFQGTTRDITKRKLAEKALQESELSYKTLAQNLPDIIYRVHIREHNRMVFYNDRLFAITGYHPEELVLGNVCSLEHLIFTDDLPMVHKTVKDAFHKNNFFEIQYRFRHKNGEIRMFQERGRVILGDDKKPLYIDGVIQDITERIITEQAIKENAKRMQSLYGSMTELVAINELTTDSSNKAVDYLVVDCNPAFSEVTGITKENAVGRLASQLYGTGTAPYLEEYARVVSTGEPTRFETFFEPLKKHFNISAFSMGGNLFATVTTDVTEQKALAEQLQQKQKMEAIGQLAGGVAHDYNNQLAVILGYADMIGSSAKDPEVVKYAQSIVGAAIRSKNLTSQLLAYSRKGKYLTQEINLHQIINETVEILSHTIDKRIVIKVHLNADNATIMGDPNQIQNAILNLALNARDAMPNGGELVFASENVDLDKQYCLNHLQDITPGNYLRISVADIGVGMSKEIQARIFEPFFTTKGVGKGIGMGLASVYGIVKTHKGAIRVYSEPGKGSVFYLYFSPIHGDQQKAIPSIRSLDIIKGSGNILVVDDEEAVVALLSIMLKELGYKTVFKPNGREAIDYFRENWENLDLVILDMVMPELGGRDTFVEMKKINPHVRALLSSGYSLNGEAQKILDEGVLDFIQKPYQVSELSKKIHDALNR